MLAEQLGLERLKRFVAIGMAPPDRVFVARLNRLIQRTGNPLESLVEAFCATARGRPSRWNGCARPTPSIWSMRARSPAKGQRQPDADPDATTCAKTRFVGRRDHGRHADGTGQAAPRRNRKMDRGHPARGHPARVVHHTAHAKRRCGQRQLITGTARLDAASIKMRPCGLKKTYCQANAAAATAQA